MTGTLSDNPALLLLMAVMCIGAAGCCVLALLLFQEARSAVRIWRTRRWLRKVQKL